MFFNKKLKFPDPPEVCRHCGDQRTSMMHYCKGVEEQTQRIHAAAEQARKEKEAKLARALLTLRELGVPLEGSDGMVNFYSPQPDVESLAEFLMDEKNLRRMLSIVRGKPLK